MRGLACSSSSHLLFSLYVISHVLPCAIHGSPTFLLDLAFLHFLQQAHNLSLVIMNCVAFLSSTLHLYCFLTSAIALACAR